MNNNIEPGSQPPQAPTYAAPAQGAPVYGQPQDQGHPVVSPGVQPTFGPVHGDPTGHYGQGPARASQKKQKNVMGIIAFVVGAIGFIFGCIPGALIVGWVLLPIAFVLSIVSFFLKGGKGFSIAALVVSVVGTIVSILVFVFVVASAFDSAFSDDVTADPPAGEISSEQAGPATAEDAVEGARESPYALGTVISSESWDVTITDVKLDATDEVMAENEFNEKPESGFQYMLVDVEVKYTGDNPDGEMPMLTVEYVSPDGNTFDGFESMAVAPNELDTLETLYNGASTSGSLAIQIPSDRADEGVLAVNPDMLADKVYVAVK